MIDVRELRIGNNLIYSETGTYFTVTDINTSASVGIGVKNNEEETWIELEYFEPVILTPRILEKCGFKKFNPYSYRHNDFVLIEWNKDGFLLKEFTLKDTVYQKELNHLHQLQNLFYFLSGNELEIKL